MAKLQSNTTRDILTEDEAFLYIQDRSDCDYTCMFWDKCPFKIQGQEAEVCVIQMNIKLFPSMYNLLHTGSEGLDKEIYAALLEIKKDSLDNENIKQYFDATLKAKTAIYGTQKGKTEPIESITINITPVDPISSEPERAPDLPFDNVERPKPPKAPKQPAKAQPKEEEDCKTKLARVLGKQV